MLLRTVGLLRNVSPWYVRLLLRSVSKQLKRILKLEFVLHETFEVLLETGLGELQV